MHTIYTSYTFDEVRYCKNGQYVKTEYGVFFDYEIEIRLRDIAVFYILPYGYGKQDMDNTLKVLNSMEENDLIDYDQLEMDKEFVNWLKEKHQDSAYAKLVEELEEDI